MTTVCKIECPLQLIKLRHPLHSKTLDIARCLRGYRRKERGGVRNLSFLEIGKWWLAQKFPQFQSHPCFHQDDKWGCDSGLQQIPLVLENKLRGMRLNLDAFIEIHFLYNPFSTELKWESPPINQSHSMLTHWSKPDSLCSVPNRDFRLS